MNLVARVKNILLTPTTEWPVIEGETGDAAYLFKNYVAILAAIPALCGFVGMVSLGMGIIRALAHAIIGYFLTFVVVYVLALIINALAEPLGGRKNFANAMKVSVYFPTALWLAGVFGLVPALAILMILGAYSIYVLYIGLPLLMKAPQQQAVAYTAAVVVGLIVLWLLALKISGAVTGMPMF